MSKLQPGEDAAIIVTIKCPTPADIDEIEEFVRLCVNHGAMHNWMGRRCDVVGVTHSRTRAEQREGKDG